MSEFLPVSKISVPDGRLRQVDEDWAAFIGASMKEVGQKAPIDVVAEGDGFTLVAGGHRLRGAQLAKMKTIEARVLVPEAGQTADDLRLHEVLENLARKDFNALERCEALFELKRIHEAKFPDAKHGGKRGNQHTGGEKRQVAIFAFCQSASESTGLSRRSVELAVQIFEGLSPATRERIKGTAMAEKQADLKALAGMEAELQGKVLDLVFAYPDQPMALGDAERKARGLPVLNDADKILRATQGGLTRLSKTTRQILFSTYKDEIMEMAKREGWIDG